MADNVEFCKWGYFFCKLIKIHFKIVDLMLCTISKKSFKVLEFFLNTSLSKSSLIFFLSCNYLFILFNYACHIFMPYYMLSNITFIHLIDSCSSGFKLSSVLLKFLFAVRFWTYNWKYCFTFLVCCSKT